MKKTGWDKKKVVSVELDNCSDSRTNELFAVNVCSHYNLPPSPLSLICSVRFCWFDKVVCHHVVKCVIPVFHLSYKNLLKPVLIVCYLRLFKIWKVVSPALEVPVRNQTVEFWISSKTSLQVFWILRQNEILWSPFLALVVKSLLHVLDVFLFKMHAWIINRILQNLMISWGHWFNQISYFRA